MSKDFIQALEEHSNFTKTENGAVALKSTKSDLVDLFGSIGGLRNESDERIISKFSKAFAEDRLLAMKILFYTRDIRGGLGERRVPRTIYKFLAEVYNDTLIKNLKNIVNFGRWDDIFELLNINSRLNDNIIHIIKNQLIDDMSSTTPSLMAKWIYSTNASNKDRNAKGRFIAKSLGKSDKEYRKILSFLRNQISVVESKMSANKFNEIEYSHVPSRAMNIYRNAFRKKDEDRFNGYIESLQKGETKINSSTLYPYDIIEKLYKFDPILEEQWKALPNYIEGENNVLIMADTSGSMYGRPMDTSIGLAMYFAERNKGYYHNKFMTFSRNPEFVELKGNTLYERRNNIREIIDNTDLEKAFMLILNTALQNKISQEDMPKSLVVISDMQFDSCQRSGWSFSNNYSNKNGTNTWHDEMENRFNSSGYQMPNIVYWNVADRTDSFQVACEHKGVQLVSGQSTAIFKTLLANIGKTPYQAMLDVLNNERYDSVTI